MKPKTRVRKLANGMWVGEHRVLPFMWRLISWNGFGNGNHRAFLFERKKHWFYTRQEAQDAVNLFLARGNHS